MIRTSHWHVVLILAAAFSLTLPACGSDDDDNETDTSTDTAQDTTADTPSDATGTGVTPEGVARMYRFTDLELAEPQVSLLPVLNPVVGASLGLPPEDAEALHVMFSLDNWDLTATPVGVELTAGAGVTADMGATFSLDTTTAPVTVASFYRDVDGKMKLQNDLPTSLEFPIRVGDTTTFLPLKDLLFDTCYGGSPACTGTDETAIYGVLTGAIIESEANGIDVELNETLTLQFGEILRDPAGDCTSDAECMGTRKCGRVEAGKCEREPQLMVDGQPAFALEGQFTAVMVTAAP